MNKFSCNNGKLYEAPDDSCLFCKKCTDIYFDNAGPYGITCTKQDEGKDVATIRFLRKDYKLFEKCEDFDEE